MCCLVSVLALLGPRAAILVWWLMAPARWDAAFASWIWPIVGFFIAPWTTMSYVLVAPGGIHSLDWIWIAIGIFLDLTWWFGGAWGNRDRYPGYTQRA